MQHANLLKIIGTLGILLISSSAFGSELHQDPVVPVLLGLVIIFLGAKLGGWVAYKFSQPPVLGELIVGILLGNLSLAGFHGIDFIMENHVFFILSSIGVIMLLFEVGLESSLHEMIRVGIVSTMVAIIGVIFPFILGYGTSLYFMPEKSVYVHAFVGAALCATSVGITARVLKDLRKLQIKEAKIILGAAVIDDVLGLIILAVVAGLIMNAETSSEVSLGSITFITFKAVGFLAAALFIGTKAAPYIFRFGARLKVEGVLLSLSLCFCFILAYLANLVQLAPIVGAFAAGLIIDGKSFSKLFGDSKSLEDLIFPISRFFVPIFFIHTGMQVKLSTFTDPKILTLGLSLSLAAILGKQLCGFGVFGKERKTTSRLLIGIGMIPRGEVGLIFATIGATLTLHGMPIVDDGLYSSIILMVMITTLVTPPGIKWALENKKVR